MTAHMLSKVPVLGKFVDERFLEHRRRSTSLAGIAGALLAIILFEYHIFHDHSSNWELLSVVVLMVVVKLSMMLWYRFHD
jgi:hypothetical protein